MTHASVAGSPLDVPEALIRLSVGIEGAADLIEDLRQALDGRNHSTGRQPNTRSAIGTVCKADDHRPIPSRNPGATLSTNNDCGSRLPPGLARCHARPVDRSTVPGGRRLPEPEQETDA